MFGTKVIGKEEHSSLLAKANSFEQIVSKVVEENPEIASQDVTPEIILQMMQAKVDPEAQSKLEILQNSYNTLAKENSDLKSQVANLLSGAAEDPAIIVSADEVDGKEANPIVFLNENKGNHSVNLEYMKKNGLI